MKFTDWLGVFIYSSLMFFALGHSWFSLLAGFSLACVIAIQTRALRK